MYEDTKQHQQYALGAGGGMYFETLISKFEQIFVREVIYFSLEVFSDIRNLNKTLSVLLQEQD